MKDRSKPMVVLPLLIGTAFMIMTRDIMAGIVCALLTAAVVYVMQLAV